MLTVTDIFAGAGGSSTGAASVPGVHVALAANHWKLAVDVHQNNHQATDHACVDLHLEDPRNFPKTDMLWASPECTKWSIANSKAKALSVEMGGDPTLFDDIPAELECEQEEIDRSRLLMFDVLRFIEHHRYRAVVVENVVDVATQGKYSRAWQSWQRGLRKLGYAFRVVSMNSMHAQAHGLPSPQSRDRLYVVAWPVGERAPDIDAIQRPKAYCPRCEQVIESRQSWKNGRTVGRYRAQYVFVCNTCSTIVEPAWLPASHAIDWTIRGQRIGDRDKPLSEKTMARIREGLRRYGREFTCPTSEPLRTQTTAYTRSLLVPVEGRDGKQAMLDSLPMRTQTTRNELGILTTLRGVNAPKLTRDAMDTIAASGNHHGLLVPSGGTWHENAYPIDDAMRTVTTRDNHGLLVPYYSASETAKPTSHPVGTLTTVDRYALIDQPAIDPEDCTFRMLEPHEIAAGMSFPLDYLWHGTKRERVRLAGNAVTPPAARDLVAAVAESLGGAA